MENSILYTDLMNESLEFRSAVCLLPLIAVQRVHQPCDQPGWEDGGVSFVEVLEISQRVQPPWTQNIDEPAQEEESRGKILHSDLEPWAADA